ncbi:MAG: hypothetical protein SF187_06860 [Deltaproteobacteria bacterium]|nr:hypothetical protein [Deltaproteobacteria bacterium]
MEHASVALLTNDPSLEISNSPLGSLRTKHVALRSTSQEALRHVGIRTVTVTERPSW